MFTRIMEFWCRLVHRRAMWPMHGKYICSRCLREYPLNWDIPYRPVSRATTLVKPARLNPHAVRENPAVGRKSFSKNCTSAAGMP
jgi:hypothetical protein